MAATVRASEIGLAQVEQARRKKQWKKSEQAWFQLANTSASTLKRFWAGKPIQADAFEAICKAIDIDDWQSIIESAPVDQPTVLSPSIYSESTWVERTELAEILLPIMQSDCRVLALNGITGIGKTMRYSQIWCMSQS